MDLLGAVVASLMEMARKIWPGPVLAAGRLWKAGAPFESEAVETDFKDWRAKLSAPQRRAGLYFALLAWTAAIGFDLSGGASTPVSSALHPAILAMRGAGVLALIGAITGSSLSRFETFVFAEVVIWILSTTLQTLLITMATTQDLPFDFVADVPGPILLIFLTVGLFGIAARSFLLMILVVTPYNLFALYRATAQSMRWGHPDPVAKLGSALLNPGFDRAAAYVLIASLIAYAIIAQLERGAREAFSRERRLSITNLDLETARLDSEVKAAALIAAKEDLRTAAERESAAKSRFLAEAAHDLSQPFQALSMLLGAAGQAVQGADLDRATGIIADASRAAALARSFFASVLQLSSLESGLVAPKIEACDLVELASDVVGSFAADAAARGVTIYVRARAGHPIMVATDRTMLARVLANLVSNAVRCADRLKPESLIVVDVGSVNGRARLGVLDNGVGISQARQAEIFTPLRQLRHPLEGESSGLGLGLSIVRTILRLLPGHVLRLRSADGRYTCFALSLPLTTAMAAPSG